MDQGERRKFLIRELLQENAQYRDVEIPAGEEEQSMCQTTAVLITAFILSVGYSCISTGEYHFPNDRAAQIAVGTVKEFMRQETSVKKVAFNVFKDLDKEIYRKLL